MRAAEAPRRRHKTLAAVFARDDGTVLDLPGVRCAVDGGAILAAEPLDFVPMPEDSLLLTLPRRSPIGVSNGAATAISTVDGGEICAVAAALPPGFTRTVLPAFVERDGAPPLPLYGYAAVAWGYDRFWAGAIRTDATASWMPERHAARDVSAAVERRMKESPGNELLGQLARCALEYGCYTAQNTFLTQGEAAIVVSPACNAQCIGCISEQLPETGVAAAQARVRRLASKEDIVEVAVAHLRHAEHAIVSFGQGCEGEPLLAAPTIAEAIRDIRRRTSAGMLHCNTNASRPDALRELIDAGLQSIRVSTNSVRPDVYASYYRPRGYDFSDVCECVALAARRGISISLNLLTHPGVTDDVREIDAFEEFMSRFPIGMVQTRTLNIDPLQYFAAVGRPEQQPIGMRAWLAWMRERFPHVRIGNFTRGFG